MQKRAQSLVRARNYAKESKRVRERASGKTNYKVLLCNRLQKQFCRFIKVVKREREREIYLHRPNGTLLSEDSQFGRAHTVYYTLRGPSVFGHSGHLRDHLQSFMDSLITLLPNRCPASVAYSAVRYTLAGMKTFSLV